MNSEKLFGLTKEQRLFVLYLCRRRRELAVSYRQLERQTGIGHSMLEKLFIDGVYKGLSFEKMCRLLQILGVSPTTASQVLGIHPNIEEKREQQVAEAALRLYLLETQDRLAIIRMIDFRFDVSRETSTERNGA